MKTITQQNFLACYIHFSLQKTLQKIFHYRLAY